MNVQALLLANDEKKSATKAYHHSRLPIADLPMPCSKTFFSEENPKRLCKAALLG